MASTNKFHGLARGPIDHNASSVINAVANGAIQMGAAIHTQTTILSSELLPRVNTSTTAGIITGYGVAVGGDNDGIYNDGSLALFATNPGFFATSAAGQGIVVVTQGRCPARVFGNQTTTGNVAIVIGDKLTLSATPGLLQKAQLGEYVVARSLNTVASGDMDMIAVDIQREGADTDT